MISFPAFASTVTAILISVGLLSCSGEPAPTPPRDPTIAEAQSYVPFPIQAPSYIPDGYEMDPHVSFLDSRHYGNEVKGVRFALRKYTPRGYKNIHITQFLAEGTFPSTKVYVGEYVTGEMVDLGGFEAEVRQADLGDQGPLVAVEWETTHDGKRIFWAVRSHLELEETLKVVRSFRTIE